MLPGSMAAVSTAIPCDCSSLGKACLADKAVFKPPTHLTDSRQGPPSAFPFRPTIIVVVVIGVESAVKGHGEPTLL